MSDVKKYGFKICQENFAKSVDKYTWHMYNSKCKENLATRKQRKTEDYL